MTSYGAVITTAFAAIFVPGLALTILLRPRPFKYVLRGGEVAICLAVTIDSGRRLLLIANGSAIPYPGTAVAVVNIFLVSLVALLLWARVAQVARHRARNREHAKLGIEQLKREGVDTSDVEAMLKKGKA